MFLVFLLCKESKACKEFFAENIRKLCEESGEVGKLMVILVAAKRELPDKERWIEYSRV